MSFCRATRHAFKAIADTLGQHLQGSVLGSLQGNNLMVHISSMTDRRSSCCLTVLRRHLCSGDGQLPETAITEKHGNALEVQTWAVSKCTGGPDEQLISTAGVAQFMQALKGWFVWKM